ncbi:MAG: hypothetical protein Q7J65_06030 [Candidatus Marinimicrobia bacterium]|nr:hypothetical protein [Candidatus Neomarinimicrobiota bacterium]
MNQISNLSKPPIIFAGVISHRSLPELKSEIQNNLILAGSNGFEIDGPGFSWAFPQLGFIRHQLEQLVSTITLEIGPAWTRQNARMAGVELSISIPANDRYILNILAPLVRRELSGSLLNAKQSTGKIRVSPLEHWDKQMFIRKIVDLLPHESGLSPALYYFGSEISDEPAFRETNLYGYSVLLRENIGRKTNARYYLRNNQELNKMLIWFNSL